MKPTRRLFAGLLRGRRLNGNQAIGINLEMIIFLITIKKEPKKVPMQSQGHNFQKQTIQITQMGMMLPMLNSYLVLIAVGYVLKYDGTSDHLSLYGFI